MSRYLCCLTAMLLALPAPGVHALLTAQADPWAEAMAAFEKEDREGPPRAGGIVFVGSSSIRLWDLARDFPGLPVINRGFGGSQVIDAVRHLDLLVLRHKPRIVVLYAGDNDLAAGKTPQQVAGDFGRFVAGVHAASPAARIAFIGIKPSIQRWKLIAQVREANTRIRQMCEGNDLLAFIDVDGPMLGWDERPRKDLFVADGLHLSSRGYALWAVLVRPFLE